MNVNFQRNLFKFYKIQPIDTHGLLSNVAVVVPRITPLFTNRSDQTF